MESSGMFSNAWVDDQWDPDTSQFIFDSPQPDHLDLPSTANTFNFDSPPSGLDPSTATSATVDNRLGKNEVKNNSAHLAVQQDPNSKQSSASASSSFSSSSDSAHKKRRASSTSSPNTLFGANNAQLDITESQTAFKVDSMFGDSDNSGNLKVDDSTFPGVNSHMDSLSLTNSEYGFGGSAAPPSASMSAMFESKHNNELPQHSFQDINHNQAMDDSPMTIAPSKMFSLNSREDSPNDNMIMNSSNESSPFPAHAYLPLAGAFQGFNSDVNHGATAVRLGFNASAMTMQALGGFDAEMPSNNTGMTSAKTKQPAVCATWPCQLTIDAIPEKCRVETQIPIFLKVSNPPQGFNSIHLPTHTISKPKFQHQKPLFEKNSETLELSVSLVCTSAMQQKEGALERAFERAADGVVPERKDEPANAPELPEDDPSRPLNGGPVTVCSGCMVRERKRAARKKTKKIEEEEIWLKDEAKRIIVFNCVETRDWVAPGTKETPVKEATGPFDEISVHLPMRIACYCRHQGEKVGFQVIFTLRTPEDEILGQAISPSILITDDHKQPPPTAPNMMAYGPGAMGAPGLYRMPDPSWNMFGDLPSDYPLPQTELAMRPSYSSPNLSTMNHSYAQNGPFGVGPYPSKNISSRDLSHQGTSGTVTPRTLSRPASPTYPSSQPSNKKRRSAGPGHSRLPYNLSMTKLNTARNPTSSMDRGYPFASGPTSAGFNYRSPMKSEFDPTILTEGLSHAQTLRNQAAAPHQYHQSGPATPMHHHSHTPAEEDYYFSAPTSHHHSRAASPSSASRYANHLPHGQFSMNPHHANARDLAIANDIPIRTAAALSKLPAGFNLQRPPIMQQIVPAEGSRHGGDECTILGRGFFQGLSVMFGDLPADQVVFWGESAIVCRVPRSLLGAFPANGDGSGNGKVAGVGVDKGRPTGSAGTVKVVFGHQHPGSYGNVVDLYELMPTAVMEFTYTDALPKPSPGGLSSGSSAVAPLQIERGGMVGLPDIGSGAGAGVGTGTGTGTGTEAARGGWAGQ